MCHSLHCREGNGKTSALDTKTEQIIQQSFAELAENRTMLVIAHRLATIRDEDRVIVVTEDGIAETGSTMNSSIKVGFSARLHNNQFQEV